MSPSTAGKERRLLRQEMNHVRSRMPYSMDDAKAEVKQLADWKYYIGRFPAATLGAAAAIGYLVVPVKKQIISPDAAALSKLAAKNRLVVEQRPKAEARRATPVQLGLNMLTNVLLRAATAFAGQQIGKVIGIDLRQTR